MFVGDKKTINLVQCLRCEAKLFTINHKGARDIASPKILDSARSLTNEKRTSLPRECVKFAKKIYGIGQKEHLDVYHCIDLLPDSDIILVKSQ